MKSSTKKIIAREFLFLLGLFALTALVWLCILAYNYSLQTKAEGIEKELLFEKNKLDSLLLLALPELDDFQNKETILLHSKLQKDGFEGSVEDFVKLYSDTTNAIKLVKALKENYKYTGDVNSFMNDYIYPKRSILKFKIKLFDHALNNGFIPLSASYERFEKNINENNDFLNELYVFAVQTKFISQNTTYTIFLENIKNDTLSTKLNNDIVSQRKLLAETNNKKNNILQQLDNDAAKRLLVKFFLFGLLILFGGRYLYIATKWAIKTVKE